MTGRNYVTLLIAAGVIGCSDPRTAELEDAEMAMAQLAAQCRKDTETVPAEHSMHCIEATKLVHPHYHAKDISTSLVSHCSQNESAACQGYVKRLFLYKALYWRAIAQSLDNFGAPVQSNGRSAGAGMYEFAKQMEPYFAQCLEQHPDPPKPPKRNAQPRRSYQPPAPEYTVPRPENRHCIALGTNKPPMLE
jgi:hypothetical protein